MKLDIRPHLFVRCAFCEDEGPNCYSINEVRWSLVDEKSAAKPLPICEECHENSDAPEILPWNLLARVEISEPTLEKLRECCGYVENGTPQTVSIGQDDATRGWYLSIPSYPHEKTYHGRSFKEVIEKAYEEQRQFDDEGNLL